VVKEQSAALLTETGFTAGAETQRKTKLMVFLRGSVPLW
jgi:hypothetical protein